MKTDFFYLIGIMPRQSEKFTVFFFWVFIDFYTVQWSRMIFRKNEPFYLKRKFCVGGTFLIDIIYIKNVDN